MTGDIVNMPVSNSPGFMENIVDMNELLRQFELDMKRKKLISVSDDGKEVYYSYGKPRISDEGLQDVIAEIRAFLNNNTPYSYTLEEEFNNIMRVSCKAFAIRLWVKMKEWKIEPSDYLVICDKVRILKELSLRKSIKGNFQGFSQGSKSSTETIIREEQNRGGLFGIFGPPKKPTM